MTTSDPRTGQHDDNPPEHRGLGKRILDAVLGDPADQQTDRTHDRPAGPDDRGTAHDARRDAGYADPVARAGGHDPGDPGRDPLASDAPHDLAAAGYEDRRPADRTSGYAAASTGSGVADRGGAGQDFVTESYDPDRDRGYDPQAAGTAMEASGGAGAGADRDFVTSSYDPDRDRGYDPQAAGTAVETDPAQGPVARNTRPDADEVRGGGSRDYDAAQDTGYVDAARAEADRTTGRRDDDYDTGRVDTGPDDRDRRQGDRVGTERDEPDRTDRHRGVGAAAAGVLGAAAAAFGGSDRDRSDRDRSDRDRDREFSKVDDTATVDDSDTGRSTPDTGDRAQGGIADEDRASGGRERLVPADRAQDYTSRWDALKGDFVDEPRRAVRKADDLVGEVLDEIQRLFADQRRGLEQSFDHDRASTEDLRLALRRYRSFFDRLLSF